MKKKINYILFLIFFSLLKQQNTNCNISKNKDIITLFIIIYLVEKGLLYTCNNYRTELNNFIYSFRKLIFQTPYPTEYLSNAEKIKNIKIFFKKQNLKLDASIKINSIIKRIEAFNYEQIEALLQILKRLCQENNTTTITVDYLLDALLEMIFGPKFSTKIDNANEETILEVAIHEIGHALLDFIFTRNNKSYYLFDFVKLTNRKNLLGVSYSIQNTINFKLYTKEKFLNYICSVLGGRAAQESIINTLDDGARADLTLATNAAKYGIKTCGFGVNLSTESNEKDLINEVNEILKIQYSRALSFCEKYKELIVIIANELVKKKLLFSADIEKIVSDYEKNNNIIVNII